MIKFQDLKITKVMYQEPNSEKYIQEFGNLKVHQIFPNGIEVSILLNSRFASLSDKLYEVAFLKDGLPIDLPESIKKEFSNSIVFNYYLTFIPQRQINHLFRVAEKMKI